MILVYPTYSIEINSWQEKFENTVFGNDGLSVEIQLKIIVFK
jgi:hypothetical protein